MPSMSELMVFLRENEAEHRHAAAVLASDSREDEANFEKIRANVFGIFKAVLETALKKYGETGLAEEFFAKKLREIPATWRAALASAGESEEALVEKLKLESVSEIEKAMKEGTK